MRYMRLLTALLLAALLGALTGCGGGGNNTRSAQRTVTITLRWPTTNSKSARVIPQSISGANAALVEIYDGNVSIGRVTFVNGVNSQLVTVPGKALTFYANAFTDPATPLNTYFTDPKTGILGTGTQTNIVPLPLTTAHAVAHAVTVVDVTTTVTVAFTLENTIASFAPITTPTDMTAFALDAGPISLNGTVQAKTADGAVVLTGANSLTWAIDSTNALENARAAVDATNPANPRLTLKATGVVHVTLTDSEVTPDPLHNGNPYTATITYTITPRAILPQPQLTLNTLAGSPLSNTLPDYTRSLTFTQTQTPLVNPLAVPAPPVLDGPPPPASVTSTVTVTYPAGVRTVALGTAPVLTLINSGRTVTLLVQAWSNVNGTGVVLAENQLIIPAANLPSANTPVDISLISHVTGFTLTPPNPTITLVPSSNAQGLNTVRLKVTATLDNSAATPEIDPFYLNVLPLTPDPTVATVSLPTDPGGSHYLLVTGLKNTPAGVPAVLTVQDNAVATKSGSTLITIVNGVAGAGLHIN